MLKGSASFDQGVFLMHLHKGKEYFDKNQLQKAREELESAHHLRPQDEKVLNMLGMTYFKLEMLPQAEEMYVALSTNNPDIYTLQSNLGLIRLKLEKLAEAEESLLRALELQPSNPKAHFYLGLLYEKKENWEEALLHFQQAKADKMVSKMYARIDGETDRRPGMLPFLVLEVISDEQSDTGKMRREDVDQAMDRVAKSTPELREMISQVEASAATEADKVFSHKEELFVKEQENPVEAQGSWKSWAQDTEKMRLQEILRSGKREPEPEVPEEAEELFEDAHREILSQTKQEDSDEDLWEKTQPSLVISEPSSPALEEVDQTEATPAQVEGSFLIGEVAADISTFLAQSREEASRTTVEEPGAEKISSPDSSPGEAGGQPLFPASEPSDIITQDSSPHEINEREELELGEDAEIMEPENSEEEVVQEGHLEPSPMTPFIDDTVVEFTQEMTSVNPPAATERESNLIDFDASREVLTPETQAYGPANLDQFSRDRFYVQPLIGADRFLLIDPHLLEIVISERLVCRIGTISSYTGNLAFSPWPSESSDRIPLIQVSGAGILFLADRRKEVFIISLNQESMLVETGHLLVAQSALEVQPYVFQQRGGGRGVSIVKISGRGTLALTCQTKPLTLNVLENLPVNIPAEALIAWSGSLSSEVIEDEELQKILMSSDEEGVFLRFSGNGEVVVEQGGLWGDRRVRR